MVIYMVRKEFENVKVKGFTTVTGGADYGNN